MSKNPVNFNPVIESIKPLNSNISNKPLSSIEIELYTPQYVQQIGSFDINVNPYLKNEVLVKNEMQILDNLPINNICDIRKILINLKSLDSYKFIKLLKDYFYNPNAMELIECVVDSITNSKDKYLIKEYFTNLKLIGKESAEGFAFNSYFSNQANAFVIKVTRKQDFINYDILTHEYFVGKVALNQLRLKYNILNFAYVLGDFKCSLPIVDNKGEVIKYCDKLNNTNEYIIYESIFPSVSFYEYCKNINNSFDDILNIYIQILYALYYANLYYKFTHYDLHANNILIRKLDYDKFYLTYDNKFFKAKYLAVIIDYGRSYVEYDNKKYGIAGFENFYIYSTKQYIEYDIYRILTDMIKYISTRADATNYINQLNILLKPFNINVMNASASSGFLSNDTLKINILDYINYILSYINNDFLNNKIIEDIPILNCKLTNNCQSFQELYSIVGFTNNTQITNFQTLYNILNTKNINKSNLNVNIDFNSQIKEYENYIIKLTTIIDNLYAELITWNSKYNINVINLDTFNNFTNDYMIKVINLNNYNNEKLILLEILLSVTEYYANTTVNVFYYKEFNNKYLFEYTNQLNIINNKFKPLYKIAYDNSNIIKTNIQNIINDLNNNINKLNEYDSKLLTII